MKCGAGEHNHSEKVIDVAETKGSTDDEFDFVVGGLGSSVGELKLGSSNNGCEVAFDFLTQIPKYGDPAPLGPGHPFGECIADLIRSSFQGQAKILLQ